MSESENLQIEKQLNRKEISRIGWALTALILFSQIGARVIMLICKGFFNELTQTSVYNLIIGTLPIYLIGLPIFLLIIRKVPKENINKSSKLTIIQLIKFTIISFATMYVFNILGMSINLGISILKGSNVVNPLANLLGKINIFETAFFVGVLAPIMEEIIFRKILLSRLRKFGDFFSIILSALVFGMFHGNLSQFFYAFALGCIFAYIVIKTGTVKYSIILHIIINLFGTVIIPTIILTQNLILTGIVGLFVFAIIIVGIVLFILNIKKVVLEKSTLKLTKSEQFQLMFKNSGMIVYSILFVVLVISVIIAT